MKHMRLEEKVRLQREKREKENKLEEQKEKDLIERAREVCRFRFAKWRTHLYKLHCQRTATRDAEEQERRKRLAKPDRSAGLGVRERFRISVCGRSRETQRNSTLNSHIEQTNMQESIFITELDYGMPTPQVRSSMQRCGHPDTQCFSN
jgi:hypothetical protein